MLNRSKIVACWERELARGRRERTPVSVVWFELAASKQVNDLLGQLAGDAALKEVATRVGSNLRIYDGLGRYGGEEFSLVSPRCELDAAVARANETARWSGPAHLQHFDCDTR